MKKMVYEALLLILGSVITFLLSGCNQSVPVITPTSSPSVPYLTPMEASSVPTISNDLAPVVVYNIEINSTRQEPGDERFQRDTVYIDNNASQVIGLLQSPVYGYVFLSGNLPDACHILRVAISPSNANNQINLDAYSLVKNAYPCPAVLQPFTTTVYLGPFLKWQYRVVVNGVVLAETARSYAPQPGDGKLSRGEVSIDLSNTKLDTTGTKPDTMAVNIHGSLIDACHQLRIEEIPTSKDNKVNIEVYSVSDPSTECTAGSQPFHVIYPLGYSTGFYSIYVNEQFIGKFEWGG
jgi:hypothetical protein